MNCFILERKGIVRNVYGYIRVSSREQNERSNIRQRQAEGIAAAKARGVKFGRPSLPLPDNFYEIHTDWRAKKITLEQAANACNMPIGTFYGKARKLEKVDEINKILNL